MEIIQRGFQFLLLNLPIGSSLYANAAPPFREWSQGKNVSIWITFHEQIEIPLKTVPRTPVITNSFIRFNQMND